MSPEFPQNSHERAVEQRKKFGRLAEQHDGKTIETHKGLEVTLGVRMTTGIEYLVFADTDRTERVARYWVRPPMGPMPAQVSDADIENSEFERKGIGTLVYDLIAHDVEAVEGEFEPHWGSMLTEGVKEFWKKRRPDLADRIDAEGTFGNMQFPDLDED